MSGINGSAYVLSQIHKETPLNPKSEQENIIGREKFIMGRLAPTPGCFFFPLVGH